MPLAFLFAGCYFIFYCGIYQISMRRRSKPIIIYKAARGRLRHKNSRRTHLFIPYKYLIPAFCLFLFISISSTFIFLTRSNYKDNYGRVLSYTSFNLNQPTPIPLKSPYISSFIDQYIKIAKPKKSNPVQAPKIKLISDPQHDPVKNQDIQAEEGFCLNVPVLMYHHVQPISIATQLGHAQLTVDSNIFEQQLGYLAAAGYHSIWRCST